MALTLALRFLWCHFVDVDSLVVVPFAHCYLFIAIYRFAAEVMRAELACEDRQTGLAVCSVVATMLEFRKKYVAELVAYFQSQQMKA